MELDLERIKNRAGEIRQSIEGIEEYASLSDGEFFSDKRNILAIKHLLLQAIEASASICSHILAKKIQKAVSSFPECFEALGEAGIIGKELSNKMKKMARFRNILVHRYWDIDDKKILEYARNNLSDFEEFLKNIKRMGGI
jgi:uncharacterized protein YutE (UPF0331/DUF86 family)